MLNRNMEPYDILSVDDRALADMLIPLEGSDELVRVTTMPLIYTSFRDNIETYYADCAPITGLVCTVSGVYMNNINAQMHNHLPFEYTGAYAQASLKDAETGDWYLIGLRAKELGTRIVKLSTES